MKRALLISFVLVFALTSVALADVDFSGSVTVTVEQEAEQLKIGEGAFTVKHGHGFNISASSDDAPNWTLSAGLKHDGGLGGYSLNLEDQLFTLDFWGNERNIGDKTDVMGFVTAGGGSPADSGKLRVSSDMMAPVDVTLDYTPAGSVVVFGEFDLDEYPMGVVVRRAYPDTDSVVGYGTFDLESVVIKAAVGATANNFGTDNLAYGADLSVPVTDEVTLSGRYEMRGTGFNPKANGQQLKGGVRYAEDEVSAGASLTLEGNAAAYTKQTLAADMSYSFTEDAKLTVDGSTTTNHRNLPARRNNTLRGNAGLSAPVMDKVSGSVNAGLVVNDKGVHEVEKFGAVDAVEAEDAYWELNTETGAIEEVAAVVAAPAQSTRAVAGLLASLNASLDIEATEKLTLKPSFGFRYFSGGATAGTLTTVLAPDNETLQTQASGSIAEVKLAGTYQIGRSDTNMGFEASQTVRSYRANSQLAKAWVSVSF